MKNISFNKHEKHKKNKNMILTHWKNQQYKFIDSKLISTTQHVSLM